MLSELNDRVRTSLRWPPMVILLVLTGWGVGKDALREYNSTRLFCSRKTAFSSPWGEWIRSKDLQGKVSTNEHSSYCLGSWSQHFLRKATSIYGLTCLENFRYTTVLGIEQQKRTVFKIFYCFYLFERVCVHTYMDHMRVKESVLFFSHMGPRDQRRLSGTAASTFPYTCWTTPGTHSIGF